VRTYFVTFRFDIHPHSQDAAEAAEADAAQDKFWERRDYLFEHQKALDHSPRWNMHKKLD
jgi:protein-disulfide isomerase